MTRGVINFVYWNGKPAVVKDKEINVIRRFLDEHENVQVHAIDIQVDQRVVVMSGPFMDQQGKVISMNARTVKVAIDSLGYILVATIERSKLSSVR